MKSFKSAGLIILITFLAISCGSSGGDSTTPSAKTTIVSGTVLDGNGNPVEGAEVTIHSDPVKTTTNSNGKFSVEVEVGDHRLVIVKGSEEIHSENITCYENTPYSMGDIKTSHNPVDDDGDGYTEDQGDCDDADAGINPGAEDICEDSIDQDCNGSDLSCPGFMTGFWSGAVARFNVSVDGQHITQDGSMLLGQAISLGPVSFPSCPGTSMTVGRGLPSIHINAQNIFSLSVNDDDTNWSVSGEFVGPDNSQGTYSISTISEQCGFIQTSGSWTSAPFTPDCIYKPIAEIVFAVPELRDCVAFEQDHDEFCTEDITSLDCPFQPLTDLGGIEQLTGLVDLDLSDQYFADHNITDVSPLFSLTGLTGLDLTGNDGIPCTQLDQLDVILGPGVVVRPNCNNATLYNIADYTPLVEGNSCTYANIDDPADTFSRTIFECFTFKNNPVCSSGSAADKFEVLSNDITSVTYYYAMNGGVMRDIDPDYTLGYFQDGYSADFNGMGSYFILRVWDNLDPVTRSVYGIDESYNNIIVWATYDDKISPNSQNTIIESNLPAGVTPPAGAVTDIEFLAPGIGLIAERGISASTGLSDGYRYDLIDCNFIPLGY